MKLSPEDTAICQKIVRRIDKCILPRIRALRANKESVTFFKLSWRWNQIAREFCDKYSTLPWIKPCCPNCPISIIDTNCWDKTGFKERAGEAFRSFLGYAINLNLSGTWKHPKQRSRETEEKVVYLRPPQLTPGQARREAIETVIQLRNLLDNNQEVKNENS